MCQKAEVDCLYTDVPGKPPKKCKKLDVNNILLWATPK